MRHVLVTGGTGQVGLELASLDWPFDTEAHFPTRAELNLSSRESIAAYFGPRRWDCVINCAAYTSVDGAEGDVGAAFAVNAQGPAWLAEASGKAGVPIIQISTDYVFDGKLDRPYREDDPVGPIGAYGASKLAGELAVRAGNPRHIILRTAWVVGVHGSNFVKTMLRLAGERQKLTVVSDQYGSPTGASDIASAVQQICYRLMDDAQGPSGTYHFVGEGEASWFDLALAIFARAAFNGSTVPDVLPVGTDDYPTKARRPANSRLATAKIVRDFGIKPRAWRESVEAIVDKLMAKHSREAQ